MLVLGVCIALVTAASQVAATGQVVSRLIGGDLLNLALVGMGVAAAAGVAMTVVARRYRSRCIVGLTLSLSPVALVAYFLLTTDG